MKHLVILALLAIVACSAVPQPPATFEVELTKPEDSIEVSSENGATIIDVTSPSGIGSARITRTVGAMPQEIIFRMHLKGLEHFSFAFHDDVVEISIPSSGGHAPIVLNKNAGPSEVNPLNASSPLWMETSTVPPGQAIPLSDGYFEIRAPRAFLESDADSFAIDWIDFYR